MAQVNPSPAVMFNAVFPPGRETNARLSPISLPPSPMSSMLPIPSWPFALPPQQDTLPSSQIAQVWSSPNASWDTVREVGREIAAKLSPTSLLASPRSSVSPRPSCPLSLLPQQIRLLSLSTAQVCLEPASIMVAVVALGNSMNASTSPVSRYPSP